jgi:endonuclease IV
VRKLWLVALLLVSSQRVLAPDETITLDDLMQSADQWAKENLSDEALRALQEVDREKVRQFFQRVEKQLHGPYVIDLASLKDTAKD